MEAKTVQVQSVFPAALILPDAPGVGASKPVSSADFSNPYFSGARGAAPVVAVTTVPAHEMHRRFWDRENSWLFLAAAVSNGADFAVTRANLQNGGHELNPVVRMFGTSSAGLAVNFAGETVGVMGLSYFFHITGHHTLERLAPVVNIGTSAGAVTFGLMHR